MSSYEIRDGKRVLAHKTKPRAAGAAPQAEAEKPADSAKGSKPKAKTNDQEK